MSAVLMLLAIIAGGVAIQAAIWIPILISWSKKRAEFDARFDRERAASGEKILRGPEKAVYRGSTGHHTALKGNGRIWLTGERLVFCKITAGVVEIPVAKITGSHEAKSFMRSVAADRVHFVVETSDGAEVGFYVSDNAGWAKDVAAIAKSG